MEDKPEFADRQAEILMVRSLVKEYINEYIQDIVMYNLSDMWILVIIHFMDGSERWGTIKKGKYGRSQSGQEKITGLVRKTYTFEELSGRKDRTLLGTGEFDLQEHREVV